jgi:hypothetical protein
MATKEAEPQQARGKDFCQRDLTEFFKPFLNVIYNAEYTEGEA